MKKRTILLNTTIPTYVLSNKNIIVGNNTYDVVKYVVNAPVIELMFKYCKSNVIKSNVKIIMMSS